MRNNQVEMVKLLKQMSQEDEYKHVIKMDRVNNLGHTAMMIAINDNNNYQMMKVLYDSTKDYRGTEVTKMLSICLDSNEGRLSR